MEKLEEVFAQYDIKKTRVFRGRKMLMCEDESGHLYGITETRSSKYRLRKEYFVKEYLIQHGFEQVDQLVENQDKMLSATDRYGTEFMIKQYFSGRECDITSLEEIKAGAANLAKLHFAAKGMEPWLWQKEQTYWKEQNRIEQEKKLEWIKKKQEEGLEDCIYANEILDTQSEILENSHWENVKVKEEKADGFAQIQQTFEKRNRELKRIAMYMQKPGRKGTFVKAYNDCASLFWKEAQKASEKMQQIQSEQKQWEPMQYGLCHGSYQHHNILFTGKGIATVGLEEFHFGIQLKDLYDFLRKVLEKNGYEFACAEAVINGYDQICMLTRMDYLYLYCMLLYPEKFWKIANRYFNAKKTWVPPKTVEKLERVVNQNRKKKTFLGTFYQIYLA